jgi:Putative adhesin
MKRAAILVLACSAAVSAADFRDVNRTVALHGNGAVEVETHKGSIQVSVWERQEVEIQARIQAEPGNSMDRRRFDATEVRIDSSPDSVRIKTYYPDFNWDSGNNPEVRYTVRMPKTARLTIRDHRSDTEVSGLQGALDLVTQRGTVHVHGLGGPLHVDTHRGDIHVEFSSFTANSSVTTYRGTVDLSMPKSSRFDLQTELGRRGSIDTDFPVMTHTIGRRGESVHGAVNGGGPSLRIETYRGEVRVHGR